MIMIKSNVLASKLKRAINRDQLILNYFPVVDVQSNSTVEVEVLARWCLKKDIHVPPVEFIRVAESNGLMPKLSNWIISTAIQQLYQWRQQGHDITMSINLSLTEIEDENIVEFIEQQLNKYDIPTEKIGFEIAERNILMINEKHKIILQKLQAIGIRLILDNASGLFLESSFELDQPWHKIKIDWLLVLQSANNFQCRSLVKKLIENAFKKSAFVIIPGIHTHEEWRSIRRKNNILAQGYYFSPPKNKDELDVWFLLSHWKPRSLLQQVGNAT